MKLLREDQAQAKGQGHIFRYSPERAVIAASLVAAGCLVLTFVLARRSVGLAAVVVTSVTLFMFVMRRYVLARFRPTNWLVALNDEGVFVNTRSYLNYHFPPEDRTVVFIPFGEIRSARSIQEWRELPDPDSRQRNNTTVQRRRFVELEITGDSTELERALTDELVRRPPTERHWYGTSGTKYQHFPVTLESRTRLRIEWGVVPAAETFLGTLGANVRVGEEPKLRTSFVPFSGSSRQEQERRLRELALSGQTLAAVRMARTLYAFDLRQARDFVTALAHGARAKG